MTGVPRAGGRAVASIRGEMPAAHNTCRGNCRFPHVVSLNEDDGWFRRSVKPFIVSRLRKCHSLLEREPLWSALGSWPRGRADAGGWQIGDYPLHIIVKR